MIASAVLALLLQVHPIAVQAATGGAPDVSLPSASGGIPFYTVKVIPGAAATTVRASGADLVDGAKTFSVSAGSSVTFRAVAGAWLVVSAYSTAVPGSGTPAAAVVAETTFAQASAVGVSTDYARADHTHGTPTIADADVPNTITIDLATLATTATTANAGDSATAFFPAGAVEIARGGTGQTTQTTAYDALNPNTTWGDITFRGTANNVRLAASSGKFLQSKGNAADPIWTDAAPPGAQYWTGAADATLSAEKDLSGFTGLVLNTTGTPTSKAANTCTNQFPRSDTASGVWTCATVALGTDVSGTLAAANGGDTTLTASGDASDSTIAGFTNVTGVTFNATANAKYLIDCYIIYTSTVTTTGITFAWDTPASPTRILMVGYSTIATVGTVNGVSQRADAVSVGITSGVDTITVENLMVLHTMFTNGANATAMQLTFTPETANSVTVKTGSVCQYRSYL